MAKLNRAADASIRGYVYQLHKSITEVFSANEDKVIQIEGIEDIDVIEKKETLSIQCKYLEAQSYSLSKIRDPICQMLLHFNNSSANHRYYLYTHFGNMPEQRKILTFADLNDMLVYTSEGKKIDFCKKNRIDESKIKAFLKKFEFTFGPNLEQQEKKLLLEIRSKFSCSQELAESFYYPRAFSHITKLASKKSKHQRSTTRDQFLAAIEKTEHVFNDLYLKYRGMERYVNEIKSTVRARKSLSRSHRVLVVMEESVSRGYTAKSIAQLIIDLVKNHYNFWDSIPWTICISEPSGKCLNKIKSELIAQNIIFNDGGETHGFNSQIFNQLPMVYRSNQGKGNSITRASYSVRLISFDTLREKHKDIFSHSVIFKVGEMEISPVEALEETHFYDLTNLKYDDSRKILLGAS